ncbi:MAG: hypothetical protein M3N51_05220 [Actinomycetota bacterium]|nr:hypothetical protein [Actinomycetota bacterium]
MEGGGVKLEGVGRLVDGGDAGDSYNYAPPAVDLLVEEPSKVETRVEAPGPVRGELLVERIYAWPRGLRGDGRSSERAEVPVATSVEVRAGEPFVRVRVGFDNPCNDRRLRFHLPLPQEVDRSWAEGQFAVVERGLAAEAGYGEVPLPTFPARGFVAVEGVAVLLQHVMEYQVVEGRELALTLLRSIGLVSRNANPYREDPAGPEVPIPAAQCRGPWTVGFALFPYRGSWAEGGVLAQMERYQHPFLVVPGTGERPDGEAPGLEVRGPGVMLSSLRRRRGRLELRLVCQQPEEATAQVIGRFGQAWEADLLGRPGEALEVRDGMLCLQLRPWEIRTVQVE